MMVEKHQNGIRVSMGGHVDASIEEARRHLVLTHRTAPAQRDLFSVEDSSPPLTPSKAEVFHSLVAKIQYIAKRVRPDILTSVSFLGSRAHVATENDWNKLAYLFGYIESTRHYGIDFRRGAVVEIAAYVDAAFMCHDGMVSRSGLVVAIAGACICAVSRKQELVTKSSTEAELVALSDMSNNVLWIRQILEEMGYKQGPTVVHEDNLSTIALITNNVTHRQSTKHVNLRYFFIRDRIRTGELQVQHVPSAIQVADMMTKPLDPTQLRRLLAYIMNT
jgi:hypothetical protein